MSMFYNILIIFFGIFIEAFPFMVIGVVVSSLLTVFVKPETVARFFPEGAVRSLLVALVAGFAFPVCECGNIPVARGLLAKGVGPGPVVTFLLAAPVFNPIAIVSTAVAFPGQPSMVWLRVLFTGVIALVVGAAFSLTSREQVCRPDAAMWDYTRAEDVLEEGRGTDSTGKEQEDPGRRVTARLKVAMMLARDEFFYVTRFLVLGALIAAVVRTAVPGDIALKLGQSPVSSILAMILLAFIISMCSNVDAFFAAAFTGTFTNGSLLAFLVFGPMIDIKALSMLYSTFKTRAILLMTGLVFLMSFLFALALNYFAG